MCWYVRKNYLKCIKTAEMLVWCVLELNVHVDVSNRARGLNIGMFCARLFICALWSPAGKGLTSWLSLVVSSVSLSLSHWYPGSGVVLDCIDS